MLAKLVHFFLPAKEIAGFSELAQQREDLRTLSAEIDELQRELCAGNRSVKELEQKEFNFREELEKVLLECHDTLAFPVLEHERFNLIDPTSSLNRISMTNDESSEDYPESSDEQLSSAIVSILPTAASTTPTNRTKIRLFQLVREDFSAESEWVSWQEFLDIWRRREAISEHFEKGVLWNMRRQREHLEGKLFQRHIDLLRLQELRRISEIQLQEAENAVPTAREPIPAPVIPVPPQQSHLSVAVNV